MNINNKKGQRGVVVQMINSSRAWHQKFIEVEAMASKTK